jgi:hypothetical protein
MVSNLDYDSFEDLRQPAGRGASSASSTVKPQVVHVQHLMLHSITCPPWPAPAVRAC